MIVTFTPNPAVDKTLLVRALRVGAVNRAAEAHLDPGGKGVNASRILHRLGHATVALTVAGGHIGRMLLGALDAEGVAWDAVRVDEDTRLNVVLHDSETGASTRVWDRGAAVPPARRADVDALVARWLPRSRVFACAGTVPPGLPDDYYADVLDRARRAGRRTLLDADGATFVAGLAGRPTVVKPNLQEAGAALGREIRGDDDALDAARELLDRGPDAVVLSMGRSGSILVTRDRAVRAIPPEVERRSAVGSGDSMVAGLLAALAEDWPMEEGLRLGTAAGAATARAVGTHLGSREDIEELLPRVRLVAV